MSSKASQGTLIAPGPRFRRFTEFLFNLHPVYHLQKYSLVPEGGVIRIVCISDTHNHKPDVPAGDVLIHAGDLTDRGSLTELQAGLDWLATLPHPHKIFVAGNHDLLLDESYSSRQYGYSQSVLPIKQKLNWPNNIVYLEDGSVTLNVATRSRSNDGHSTPLLDENQTETGETHGSTRKLKIFGSPYTPKFSSSAFKYPSTDTAFWRDRIPRDSDVVVTHGPPRLHLDANSGETCGCPYLSEEIARVRPRLHVYGHIHTGHGRKDVVFDVMRGKMESAINSSRKSDRWWRLKWTWGFVLVISHLLLSWITLPFLGRRSVRQVRVTTMVNASVLAFNEESGKDELKNEAIVIEI